MNSTCASISLLVVTTSLKWLTMIPASRRLRQKATPMQSTFRNYRIMLANPTLPTCIIMTAGSSKLLGQARNAWQEQVLTPPGSCTKEDLLFIARMKSKRWTALFTISRNAKKKLRLLRFWVAKNQLVLTLLRITKPKPRTKKSTTISALEDNISIAGRTCLMTTLIV